MSDEYVCAICGLDAPSQCDGLCASGQQVRALMELADALCMIARCLPDNVSKETCEKIDTASQVIAALTPAPQPEGLRISPEYQAIFDEAKARAPRSPQRPRPRTTRRLQNRGLKL